MSPSRDKGSRKKKWRVDFYSIVDGQRVRRKKYFQHREAALAFDRAEAEKDERRKVGLGYTESKEFRTFAHEFISRHLVGKSENYVRVIKGRILNIIIPYFGERNVHGILTRDIEDFMSNLRSKQMAGTTLFHYHTLLQTMFKKAIEWHYADINPIASIPKPRKVSKRTPSAKSELELRRFLSECDEDMRKASLILLHTGLRVGELMMLEKSDFDLVRGVLVLKSFEGHTTKNYKGRIVPLSNVVIEIIQKLPNGPIINMARKTFEKHFLKIVKRAEVSITPHELRHSYCSMMLAAGTPETDVQHFLGHKSTTMTKRYTHHIPGRYENIREKMVFGIDFVRDNLGTNVIKIAGIGGKKRDD